MSKASELTGWGQLAATTLMSSVAVGVKAAPAENPWEADATTLYYGELDRVTAVEPVLRLRRNWSAEESLTVDLTLDALTGASHNGAAVVDAVQTFTGPSGGEGEDEDESGPQTFAAGEVPLISGFEDLRFAFNGAYQSALSNPLHTWQIGTSVSAEEDYFSVGMSSGFGWEIFQRNTQVSIGAAVSLDAIEPKGGVPVPFATYDGVNSRDHSHGELKQVFDMNAGLVQILSPTIITRLGVSIGWLSGYQSDPYKIISVLDANQLPIDYLNENRPDDRQKYTLSGTVKLALGAHSLTSDARYYWDTWSVRSYTVDEQLRFNFSDRGYLLLHGRWYQQRAADFYRLYLNDNESLPNYATADYRLGNLTTLTAGFRAGFSITEQHSVSWRAEWYQQWDHQTDNPAAEMNSIITQLTYHYRGDWPY